MEPGALGELLSECGESGEFYWESFGNETTVYGPGPDTKVDKLASFYGEESIRLERVAIFIASEQS